MMQLIRPPYMRQRELPMNGLAIDFLGIVGENPLGMVAERVLGILVENLPAFLMTSVWNSAGFCYSGA